MIDSNKGVSTEMLELLRQESYERMCTQIKTTIEQKLIDFQMTWDDLAERLQWEDDGGDIANGQQVKYFWEAEERTLVELNDIAHVFSAEVYVIFRPRYPWIAT